MLPHEAAQLMSFARVLVLETGQLALGSKLAAGGPLPLNPLLAAGWAALLANALNCIPVGELCTSLCSSDRKLCAQCIHRSVDLGCPSCCNRRA